MEVQAEIERAIEELEWGELASTLEGAIRDILGETASASPPPPPPPVPTWLDLNTYRQPVEMESGGYGGCAPLGAAPQQPPIIAAPTMNHGLPCHEDSMHPGHLYDQAGAFSRGQYNDMPVMALSLPEGFVQILRCVGVLNGQKLYEIPAEIHAPPASAASPPSSLKGKRKWQQEEDDQPYIKKPPNAFMLFSREQRANVERDSRGSAPVNKVLGHRWNSMTKVEQAKYYDLAEEKRLLHSQQHPGWSIRDNYGKKRKRQRRKALTWAEESEDTQQAKKLCATQLHTAATEAPQTQTGPSSLHHASEPRHVQTVLVLRPLTQTGATEPGHPRTVAVQLPHSQTPLTILLCDHCNLLQVNGVMPAPWLDKQSTASVSLANDVSL